MKSLLVILLISCAYAQEDTGARTLEVPENPDDWKFLGNETEEGRGGRISNGYSASNTQFPFVARLSINFIGSGAVCSGSLIASNWIISARHCVAGQTVTSLQAALGSASISSSSRVIVYANYLVYPPQDIALFRLTRNLALNSYVNIIRLPSLAQQSNKFAGFTAVGAGWGGVAGGGLARTLQWANFRILSDSERFFGNEIIATVPVTGTRAYVEGGDSGGPLILYENNVPTLIGINVFYTVGTAVRYQGSTRVTSFLQFISVHTGIRLR